MPTQADMIDIKIFVTIPAVVALKNHSPKFRSLLNIIVSFKRLNYICIHMYKATYSKPV